MGKTSIIKNSQVKIINLLILVSVFGCSSNKSLVEGKSQNDLVVIQNTDLILPIKEFEGLIQDILNLNQYDFLYTDTDKKNGLTIVINNFMKPYYKKLDLSKFGKKVRFLDHKDIYAEGNEKFMDILEGSILLDKDILKIVVGVRYKYTAIEAKFKKENESWVLLNKKSASDFKYIPNYRFKKDKELCLAELIKFIKQNKITIPECLKYNFQD